MGEKRGEGKWRVGGSAISPVKTERMLPEWAGKEILFIPVFVHRLRGEKAAIKRYCISRERLELEVQWVLIRSVFRASAGALNENDSISGKPFVLRKQSPYRKR